MRSVAATDTVRRAGRRLPAKPEAESLGVRLRRMRKARGFTLAELAERAGTTKSYLSQIENRVFENPSATILAGLARALKVSIDWLVLGWPA